MIKAVIFDMDGLLIDSEPFWRRSHVEVLGNHGLVITEDDVKEMAGRRTLEVARTWKDRFDLTEPSDEALAAQVVDKVIDLVHLNGEALPGVEMLMQVLHDNNFPMAVASSSSMALINVVLDRLDLRKYMSAIHSGVNEKRGKPFPDVFLSTAAELSVKPEDCLVFEDSLTGVKAAKAAGMKCIAVPELPYDAAEFASADIIVKSLNEVDLKTIQSL